MVGYGNTKNDSHHGRRQALRRLVGSTAAVMALPWARHAGAQARPAREPVVGGTGSGLAPMRRVLEAANVPVQFVPNLGSGGGLKALQAGALDIAVSARKLNDAERAAGLVEREIFRTPFLWAAHAAVPLRALSMAELLNFYNGKITEWPDGRIVRLVLRPEHDSDTALAKSISPEMNAALTTAAGRPGMRVAVTDDEAAADIERITGAIGMSSLGLLLAQQRQVVMPPLAGVAPTVEMLANGRYPHYKTLYLVTRGAAAEPVAAVGAHLASKAGVAALAQIGCWVRV
jgi:phosphate transport system substrate-binding protein